MTHEDEQGPAVELGQIWESLDGVERCVVELRCRTVDADGKLTPNTALLGGREPCCGVVEIPAARLRAHWTFKGLADVATWPTVEELREFGR